MQLMIVVLVATLGVGIIMGWMGSIETPKYIGSVDADRDSIVISEESSGIGVTITVRDQNGDPLEGAVITMSGCGIRTTDGKSVHGTTDSNGTAVFQGLSVNSDSKVRYIDIDAVKPDFGSKRTQIVVIP